VPACGKRGSPLPPFVHVPDVVKQITTRRVGGDVYLTLTVPVQNVDASVPVDLGRIEVYGYTGVTPPPSTRFVEVAKLVETLIPDLQPDATTTANAAVPVVVTTTVRDTLTADELVTGPLLTRPASAGSAAPQVVRLDVRAPLKRFYMAIPFSPRGRPGPPSGVVELPLTVVPDAPLGVSATYASDAVSLRWDPSGGLIGLLMDLAPPPESSPLDDNPSPTGAAGTLPQGPTRYNVYRQTAPDPRAFPSREGGRSQSGPPLPVNLAPIASLGFVDLVQLDERQRCYSVTAVRGLAPASVEGMGSQSACVTPIDTFPPAAPTGLSPIAVEGAISLVWEASSERDLAGYLVLRGEAGEVTLNPITDRAVAQTRFTDQTVRAGVRYVYAVTAVDNRVPQGNVSAESARVEVTAR